MIPPSSSVRLSDGRPALHPNTSGSEEGAGGAGALCCVWQPQVLCWPWDCSPFPHFPVPHMQPLPNEQAPGTAVAQLVSENWACVPVQANRNPRGLPWLTRSGACGGVVQGAMRSRRAAFLHQDSFSVSPMPAGWGQQGGSRVTDSRISAEPLQL